MTALAPVPDLLLVTGSSRGLGLAVVAAALDAGYEVHGFSRRKPRSKIAQHERFQHHRIDLSDPAALQNTFDPRLAAELGITRRRRIGLVNNAGALDIGPTGSIDAVTLQRTFTLNAVAPMVLHGWLVQHAGRESRIRIVDISSGAATSAYAGWGSYCASKAALDMAGQVVAAECAAYRELRGRDLAVVSYAPGVVDTPMQKQIRETGPERFPSRERFVQLHEAGDLVTPAAPAAEIVALLRRDDLPRFSRLRHGE